MNNGEKYKNRYRIKSIRLEYYNYADDGWYFITICAKNRENHFGNIVNGKIKLSNIGELAKNELWRTEKMRFNIKLDEWVIMPNHLHAIIVIKNPGPVETQCIGPVETQCIASLPYKNKFGPQKNNLSSVIRGFKMSVKTLCNKNNFDFAWQPRFYDHIIRNEKSLMKIRQYIINNPLKWENDRNNIENLLM